MIISISGRSGSGKTTVVNSLIELIGKDRISYLHQDSYYKDQSHVPYEERSSLNYDHPNSIELKLFAEHLESLSKGISINKPIYNYSTHTRDKKNSELVESKEIIIADGIHILNDQPIRKLSDLNVFIKADKDLCFIRRLLRDTKERGRSVESVINQYVETVKPMQDKYVSPSIKYADFIINDGGYNSEAIHQLKELILKHIS